MSRKKFAGYCIGAWVVTLPCLCLMSIAVNRWI
jgi:phosphate/sulfate permease